MLYNEKIYANAVILTPGTFLNGVMFTGDEIEKGGRYGENPSDHLSNKLNEYGFEMGRLKTGTPPRVINTSIDYNKLDEFFDKNRFTGIFLSSYHAHGEVVYRYLESKKMTVPNDMSMVGSDYMDLEIGNRTISLDALKTNWEKITEVAVNRLFELIKKRDTNCIKHLVRQSLIVRGSVKKLSS